jgi:hypothetical protein
MRPSQTADLFANAAKVRTSQEEVAAMLKRCGWRGDAKK